MPEESEQESESAQSLMVMPQPEDLAIIVPTSGGCVDVANYSTANGGPIHQWGCHFDANQLWRFTAVGTPGDSVYAITSRHSGLALDVAGVSTAPGAPIQQWGYGGGANQKFRVLEAGGRFQLQATHSGLCVSVTRTDTAADFANGALFRQYPCNPGDWRQLFQFSRRILPGKKALVVLLQNGGYREGLPFDPEFDVAVGLHFACDRWAVDLDLGADVIDAIIAAGIPPLNRCLNPANWTVNTRTERRSAGRLLRDATNFAAEEIGKETIHASGAESKYDTVVYLQDGDLRMSRIRQELQRLAASYIIDIHVLAHGDKNGFGLNGEVTASQLRSLKTIVGLYLRSVFQQNCNGSALNSAWLTGGAQVVTGTQGINSMPVAYGQFIRRWVAGEKFSDAVRNSYNDVAPMYGAAYHFVDTYDEGAEQSRNPAQYDPFGGLDPSDELTGSVQIAQGATSLVL